MKLSEFIKELQSIESQIGSHPKLDDALDFYLDEGDTICPLELMEVDALRTMGCGCWYGAGITLKVKQK